MDFPNLYVVLMIFVAFAICMSRIFATNMNVDHFYCKSKNYKTGRDGYHGLLRKCIQNLFLHYEIQCNTLENAVG